MRKPSPATHCLKVDLPAISRTGSRRVCSVAASTICRNTPQETARHRIETGRPRSGNCPVILHDETENRSVGTARTKSTSAINSCQLPEQACTLKHAPNCRLRATMISKAGEMPDSVQLNSRRQAKLVDLVIIGSISFELGSRRLLQQWPRNCVRKSPSVLSQRKPDGPHPSAGVFFL